MPPKLKKHIKKADKNIQKQVKSTFRKKDKKPPGKKECPKCKSLVGIRKFQCQQCRYNFPQKTPIVSKESVFKKTSQKSILTILEHNLFNNPHEEIEKKTYIKSKLKNTPMPKVLAQDMIVRLNDSPHKVKYYKGAKINNNFRVFACKNPIKCVRLSQYGIVFSQQLRIEAVGLSQSDIYTINAYGLQHCHKMGHEYKGTSYLYISLTKLQAGYYRAQIKKNIVQIQLKLNIASILFGDGSIGFYILPTKPEVSEQQLQLAMTSCIQLKNATTICWINTQKHGLIVGDTLGNVKIYALNSELEHTLLRSFVHAHFNHITSIRCCPLNSEDNVIFSTGSYDGYVKIWDYNDLNSIYEMDVTSKQINDMVWDTGAKFILVSRDDNADGCSLLTFFSTSKTQKKQGLVSECEQRYVKEYNNYQHLASASNSQCCVFGSNYGGLQICNMEYLRKFSTKKKNHSINRFPFDGFFVFRKDGVINIKQQKMKNEGNSFNLFEHIISDVSVWRENSVDKIAASTYLGLLIIKEKKVQQ